MCNVMILGWDSVSAHHSCFGVMLGIKGWHHFCNTTGIMIMEWDCVDEHHSHFGVTLGNSALDLKLCGMVSYLHKGL